MPSKRTKTALVGAGVAGLTLMGGLAAAGGVANASPLTATAHSVVSTVTGSGADGESQDGGQEVAITGTVKAPTGAGEQNAQAEAAALRPLAKVTAVDAQTAATTAVPGTASAASLADADGWVVYEVTVKDANGVLTDVTVDAGSGQVLASQAGDTEINDGQGSADTAEQGDTPDAPAGSSAPSSMTTR
jgi:uncharacterized membrane protein YkoI